MLKIPKEKIIEKIKEKTGLSDKEINSKIKDKLDLLSGLISEDGAAHIVANELGVKVFEESGKLQIKNIMAGMRSVEATGKVIKMYEIRNFDKDGRKGKVGSFLIGDESGIIRVTAWNDKADLLATIKEGQVINLKNGYTRENNGRVEVHLGDKSTVTVLENSSVDVKVASRPNQERKKIIDLKENEDNVEILGTIVQVFDMKFFEVCPECNKRVKGQEGDYNCDTHGKVTPGYSYVLNLFLDDGTENIRVVLWKSQIQNLIGMTDEQIVSKKDSGFEDVKNDLLGKIVKLVGRTVKNQMFERLEFVPQLVFNNPNPEEEIEKLNKEIEAVKEEPEDNEEFPTYSQKDTGNKKKEKDAEEIKVVKTSQKKPAAKKDDDLLEEIDDLSDLDSI